MLSCACNTWVITHCCCDNRMNWPSNRHIFWKAHCENVLQRISVFSLSLSLASTICPSSSAVFLYRLWADGYWKAAFWQIWAGAVTAHPVHLGEEISSHVLAGGTPFHTTIQSDLYLACHLSQPPDCCQCRAEFHNHMLLKERKETVGV